MSSQALRNQPFQSFANWCTADAKLSCEFSLNKPRPRWELTFDDALSQRSIDHIGARRILFAVEFDDRSDLRRSCSLRLATALAH